VGGGDPLNELTLKEAVDNMGMAFESLKALTKAFVNKEVAERANSDSSILD